MSISQVGFEWNKWVEAKVSSTAQSDRDLTENETNEALELIDAQFALALEIGCLILGFEV